MGTAFRQCDSRWPPLWEQTDQPSSRWHGSGQGPVQYFADTPHGAWAEFLRHEGIRDPQDFVGIARALWEYEIDSMPTAVPRLSDATLTGDQSTYPACQAESARIRVTGEQGLLAPSAALRPGMAAGVQVLDHAMSPGPPTDGQVVVLFGGRPDLVGWCCCIAGPPLDLLGRVQFMH